MEDMAVTQLVLPLQCRQTVFKLAHKIPLAGHLGRDKTVQIKARLDSYQPFNNVLMGPLIGNTYDTITFEPRNCTSDTTHSQCCSKYSSRQNIERICKI